ncbi:MAG: type VII toxin-antitoxin system MntA family adenylyltransferase antitoxin [Anaerolineae bacterium]
MDTTVAETTIVRTLRAHPEVRLAYLYGSRVDGTVGPLSDYDVAVLLDDAAVTFEAGFVLAHELRMVLDAEVDLVVLNQAPIVLAYSVIAQGRRLLERDVATRVDYESRVLSLYGDYLPVLRQQRHDLLHGDRDAARVCRNRGASRRIDDTLAALRAAAGEKPG